MRRLEEKINLLTQCHWHCASTSHRIPVIDFFATYFQRYHLGVNMFSVPLFEHGQAGKSSQQDCQSEMMRRDFQHFKPGLSDCHRAHTGRLPRS